MVVISDCYGGTNLTCESRAYYQDFNETFEAVYDCTNQIVDNRTANLTQNILENSINIVKLQYENSLQDIDHDFMIIDVMTTSVGYNNTINTTISNSHYSFSGLNGYYSGYTCQTSLIETACLQSPNSVSCINTTNCSFYVGKTALTAGCAFICGYFSSNYNFAKTPNFSFKLCNTVCVCACTASCVAHAIVKTENFAGAYCCNVCIAGVGNVSCNFLNCYCYVYVSGTNYDFYLNNSCVCQVSLANFPCVIFCNCICGNPNTPSANNYACTFLLDFCICATNNVSFYTIPIVYATSVSTSYLVLDKAGSGTVLYDVYDANNTSTAISTSLSVNTLHSLPVATQCHIYKINQLNDGVSCIKSYAVAVTEA
jgi:hypothetical protein